MKLKNIAKKLGRQGGKARSKILSSKEKRRIASQGGRARAQSYRLKKAIEENFRYLKTIHQLSPSPPIKRVKNPKYPLPDIPLKK